MSSIRIACLGDVMLGDSFYAPERGARAAVARYGSDFVPADVAQFLRGHDVVLCNLECVLSDIGWSRNSLRALHMRGSPAAAEYLAGWGITVAHVANNHILEQGPQAAMDTVQRLEQAGISVVGGNADGGLCNAATAQYVEPRAGAALTVVGACLLREKYARTAEPDDIRRCIETQAAKGHPVIVSVHWGDEYIDRPSLWQRELAQSFLEAGAVLVVGHHPHVVQGVRSAQRGLVAYSLGDFIFDGSYKDTDWSMILSVTIAAGRIIEWQTVPIVKGDDLRPRFPQAARKDEVAQEIERRCRLAEQDIVDPQRYEAQYRREVDALQAEYRRTLWRDLARSLVRCRPVFWPQLAWRPIQRRLGIW